MRERTTSALQQLQHDEKRMTHYPKQPINEWPHTICESFSAPRFCIVNAFSLTNLLSLEGEERCLGNKGMLSGIYRSKERRGEGRRGEERRG